ncbi:hypothetical protein BKK54_03275 [Rodentibacter genomosp. 1]|uniref:Uncharacterized protein n=1 Tax=Rodentibacter genomosp. 1 TaxID=1908264 RepID=A0A1V3J7P5_9PAST|nr:hypothetical protein [Rodentibacter genomosp. 1]OOF51322.1 hypothetical protein BKK54_03275 [Rodentibacter genomosp. 1]
MFELILSTESKVLSTNIVDFEKQAEQYLATLTNTFETDDDFAKAKEEVKALKEIETKIRTAIKQTQNGDIANLIATAEQIADRFKDERLSREKLVKNKEAEIKENIVMAAFEEVQSVRSGFESSVSLALEKIIPKSVITKRLEDATKRRSTLNTLTSAVNAETQAVKAEIAEEAARLSGRLKLIPASYDYLFKDWLELITGTEDLTLIVQQRIEAEQQRETELKAKAEQEAKAKAEAEKVQAEAKAVAEEMNQQTAPLPQSAVENSSENTTALSDFIISIRLNNTTQANAVSIARELKTRFGDAVRLNQAK